MTGVVLIRKVWLAIGVGLRSVEWERTAEGEQNGRTVTSKTLETRQKVEISIINAL